MDPAICRQPKSASEIRLVRWPALLETMVSRWPTTRYSAQRIAIGWSVACRLYAPLKSLVCTAKN